MSSDSTSSEDSQADDPKYTITSPDVVTKYQEAAKIANATLKVNFQIAFLAQSLP